MLRKGLGGLVRLAAALLWVPALALAAEPAPSSVEAVATPVLSSPAAPAETTGNGGTAPQRPAAVPAQNPGAPNPAQPPETITITTGGGNRISGTAHGIFSKGAWRLYYPDAPDIEKKGNEALAADGYDVEKEVHLHGWYVRTVVLGDPASYSPPAEGNEATKAEVEKAGRAVVGFFAALFTGGRLRPDNFNGRTANNPYAKYITKDMVEGVPPGAKKMLLTRINNPLILGAQQEILTVAYTDVSDEELRRINAIPMFEMLGLKLPNGGNDAKNPIAGNSDHPAGPDGLR